MGGIDSVAASQIYQNFAFDGGDPPNDDPSEGTGDTDGDGVANFLDPDNDGDQLSDTEELARGSDINLVSPDVTGFDPSQARSDETTPVQILGKNFAAGLTVTFGSETPTPSNVTPNSIDVDVGPQSAGSPNVTVTNPNGEPHSSSAFSFFLFTPSITGVSPTSARSCVPTSVHVQGTDFEPGLAVTFGSQSPTPTNLTPTSFDVLVGPQAAGLVDVTVTNPNTAADTAMNTFGFFAVTPTITGFSPAVLDAGTTSNVQIQGTNFDPGVSVTIGAETPTPLNVTPTTFTVTVTVPQTTNVDVTVTNICGEEASALLPLTQPRRVFVSSVSYDSDLGGLAGADAKCNQLAAAAGLQGSFLAWLSDGVSDPDSRFLKSVVPYVRVDDEQVADDWADLTDGTIDTTLRISETGSDVADTVFTNVAADGTTKDPTNHCNGWTAGGTTARLGRSIFTGSTWTDYQSTACGTSHRIFCFEQ